MGAGNRTIKYFAHKSLLLQMARRRGCDFIEFQAKSSAVLKVATEANYLFNP